ncbi:MAG: ABC transporter ATP-binding protein [Clostridiales bacterium]|jgi:iron complex transport system ATP-binding protein|nr:ABC transporter ATP-binding protein [Clostridiales bacterium]
MIRAENLSFKYNGGEVLKNINISFKPGAVTGIIGPNGCGKTTLLKNISKQLSISEKTVFVEGVDIKKMGSLEIAKKIALVNQNNYIAFEFTAIDVVLMGRFAHLKRFQRESREDVAIAYECMRKTNTFEFKDKLVRELSGGELQRVMIARALCQKADIILLDEPVSQLDIHHQMEIMHIIKEASINEGLSVIMVLHDLNLAAQYSDEIILMKNGGVFKKGPPAEVINKPNIEHVYSVRPEIIKNPVTGRPFIIYYDNFSNQI